MTETAQRGIIEGYLEHMNDQVFHYLINDDSVTHARLFYREECRCVSCGGVYPRIPDYWKMSREFPFRLGTGLCLDCIEYIKEVG